jgi:hypothetical protein
MTYVAGWRRGTTAQISWGDYFNIWIQAIRTAAPDLETCTRGERQ